jgi:hypothetical protein
MPEIICIFCFTTNGADTQHRSSNCFIHSFIHSLLLQIKVQWTDNLYSAAVKLKLRNICKRHLTPRNINAEWLSPLQCLVHMNANCTTKYNTKRWYLTSMTSAEPMLSVSTCELVDVTGIFSPLLTLWLLWWSKLMQNITRTMVLKITATTVWKLLTTLHTSIYLLFFQLLTGED